MSRFVATNIVGCIRAHALARPDVNAVSFAAGPKLETKSLTYSQLWLRACSIAIELAEVMAPGERAVLLYPPGLAFVEAFLGCIVAGIVPIALYPPRAKRTEDLDRVTKIAQQAGTASILTTTLYRTFLERLSANHSACAAFRITATDACATDFRAEERVNEPAPGAPAFLQYSSGSTGFPKGVIVSHASLTRNEEVISAAFEHDQAMVIGGWLPLYHDMGLVGLLLQPLYLGASTTLMSPLEFMRHPWRWLHLISRNQIETSGAPNFAFDMCAARCNDEQLRGIDLSRWNLAFCGAEPVRRTVLERFAARFEPFGFRREAFYPCYGLAEATLFVTGSRKLSGLRSLRLSADSLARGKVEKLATDPFADGVQIVSVGRPQDGELVIVDPQTFQLLHGQVGEVWLRGASIASGYWAGSIDANACFKAYTADGRGPYLRTGDLGFLDDGELFVTGRLKDIVIVRGRNLFAEDVEDTVQAVLSAVATTTVVAVGITAAEEERLVVLVEARNEEQHVKYRAIADGMREAVLRRYGVSLDAIVLVRRGGIPRTTSGKVQRKECRRSLVDAVEGMSVVWCAPPLRGVIRADAALAALVAGKDAPP
jgi:acyl-CoA synthetase (AMP-forming)/AMP-acid ligase II